MIIEALRDCDTYFSSFAGLTTVAASWKAEADGQPLSIGFATTAVGAKRDDNTKAAIAAARRDFMITITKALKNESKVNKRICPNREGNCPEYITWPVVCRHEGKYKSQIIRLSLPSTLQAHHTDIQHLHSHNSRVKTGMINSRSRSS